MMTVRDHVLLLLEEHKGGYLSGEIIAGKLGVSRTAVWKAIRLLQGEGYPIEAGTNKGYSLSAAADVLSSQAVTRCLQAEACALRIRTYPTLPSTNQTARELAQTGEPEGAVILADQQTAGRGRQNRSFFSPANTGLYMSLLLRPTLCATDCLLLTTAAAVAVAETVEELSGRTAAIKWVNDVFMDGKKVCGILTEAALSMENGGVDYAVVGIGVNVLPPADGFPDELQPIASAVTDCRTGDLRARLAAGILNRFMAFYTHLTDKSFLSAYKRRLMGLGSTVLVVRGKTETPATLLDLDDAFRLCVRYEDGREDKLSSGEIHIRVPAGNA